MSSSHGNEVLIVGVEEVDPDCFCVKVKQGDERKPCAKGKGPSNKSPRKRTRLIGKSAALPILVNGDHSASVSEESCVVVESVLDSPERTQEPPSRGAATSSSGAVSRSLTDDGRLSQQDEAILDMLEEMEVDQPPPPKRHNHSCQPSSNSVTSTCARQSGLTNSTQLLPPEKGSSSSQSSMESTTSSLPPTGSQPGVPKGKERGKDTVPVSNSPPAVQPKGDTDCYIDSDYEMAMELNKRLNEKSPDDDATTLADAQLAKTLQEDEYRRVRGQVEITGVTKPKGALTNAAITQATVAESTTPLPKPETIPSFEEDPMNQLQAPQPQNGTFSLPANWEECPKCDPGMFRRYHLIELLPGAIEWEKVSTPLTRAGFIVAWVQRIQHSALWQRLQSEHRLMVQGRVEGFDVNEKLLYHTSRAKKTVICEEGLDQRLSRSGLFGTGIYFSDNPTKCNSYWVGAEPRIMFACRVLLGDIKVYPRGRSDQQLRREPLKEYAVQPGEPKTYDSVCGNVSGCNEYVVYNTYRVLPEYVISYVSNETGRSHTGRAKPRGRQGNAGRKLSAASFALQQAIANQFFQPYGQPMMGHPGSVPHMHQSVVNGYVPVASQVVPSQQQLQGYAVPPGSNSSATMGMAAPPHFSLPTPATVANTTTPKPQAGVCFLCSHLPSMCRCGINSRGHCKHCSNQPSSCVCPPYTTSTGEVLPFRCLTPSLKKLTRTLNGK